MEKMTKLEKLQERNARKENKLKEKEERKAQRQQEKAQRKEAKEQEKQERKQKRHEKKVERQAQRLEKQDLNTHDKVDAEMVLKEKLARNKKGYDILETKVEIVDNCIEKYEGIKERKAKRVYEENKHLVLAQTLEYLYECKEKIDNHVNNAEEYSKC